MGPEIFAWIGAADGLMDVSPNGDALGAKRGNQAARRLAVTSISKRSNRTQCRVFTFKSSGVGRQFTLAGRAARLALRGPSRGQDHPGRAVERARAQFETEQALGFERTG
jgi:hypothetical protein